MPLNDPRRVVALEGVRNFRDLGGYPTVDGLTTVWGQVYRADAVSLLTQDGWRGVSELGIKRIYDLRRQGERDRSPTIEHGLDHDVVHLDVGDTEVEMTLIDWFRQRGTEEPWDEAYMAEMYRNILTDYADAYVTLFTELANPSHRPAVFHCTAGKDRTGIAAAMLLEVLGVDSDLILDDYELTNVVRSNQRIVELTPELEAAGIDVEIVRPYLSAPRATMAATLDWLHADHGGAEGFLLAAGVTEDTLGALRADLLTDDAA